MKPDEEKPPVLNLPVFFDVPQMEHKVKMTWETVMRETEPLRQYYMQHFYSPEERLRNMNPKRFSLF